MYRMFGLVDRDLIVRSSFEDRNDFDNEDWNHLNY